MHQLRQLRRRTEQHEHPVQQMEHERSQAALDVLLKHPAVAADQQNICSMLQVSRGWRAAVQNSGPGVLSISVNVKPKKQLAQAGFGVWLPKHYQLVSSMEIYHDRAREEAVDITSELISTACSLQSAMNSPHWQLRSFRSDDIASSALLLALPVCVLTELSFTASPKHDPPPVARFSELARLDLGRSLTVVLRDQCGLIGLTDVSGGCGASTVSQLAALSKLTRLSMCSVDPDSALSLLPEQLQDLQIRVKRTQQERPHVLLHHLTALQKLDIISTKPIAASLPQQLQQLSICNWCWKDGFSLIDTFGVTGLQQLQQLELGLAAAEPLQSLSALTQLQHVGLQHQGSLEDAHSLWDQLPALCSLDLLLYMSWPAEIRKITRGLAVATGLTSLRLDLRSYGIEFCGEASG